MIDDVHCWRMMTTDGAPDGRRHYYYWAVASSIIVERLLFFFAAARRRYGLLLRNPPPVAAPVCLVAAWRRQQLFPAVHSTASAACCCIATMNPLLPAWTAAARRSRPRQLGFESARHAYAPSASHSSHDAVSSIHASGSTSFTPGRSMLRSRYRLHAGQQVIAQSLSALTKYGIQPCTAQRHRPRSAAAGRTRETLGTEDSR